MKKFSFGLLAVLAFAGGFSLIHSWSASAEASQTIGIFRVIGILLLTAAVVYWIFWYGKKGGNPNR